ncbi:uncharacterized protein LOC131164295 isoform X2 [Malania oleifera]|uniref:uncharacterized protein LOC131164295 isoform X2 n=1 Tax=Malania oleifera TaxID=397392 RepID=UPI0025AE2989|nr:uncharacterized protein LOC131164295 isoform X2 [Malania oleifera]
MSVVKRGLFASDHKFKDFLQVLRRFGGCPTPNGRGFSQHIMSACPHQVPVAVFRRYGSSFFHKRASTKPDSSTKVKENLGKIEAPLPPVPPKPSFSAWARWVFGIVLSLLLPFWNSKWRKLQQLEGEVEMVAEEVERVAEIVEKAATVAEKVSAEAAEKLPDNGKLKEAALFVEHVSRETAKDAHLTQDFIHKVDALKQDFEELETVVRPLIPKTP